MNKSEYKKVIIKIIEEIRWDLFLGHWKINVKFGNSDSSSNTSSEARLAVVQANPVYSNAIITVYPMLAKQYGDNTDMLREVITHELVHCITEELYSLSTNRYSTPPEIQTANEKLVQHITRIVRWNHDPKEYEENKKHSQKNRRGPSQMDVTEIQVPKSSHGNRPPSGIHNKRTRQAKNRRTIQVQRNKDKKNNSQGLE